MNKMANSVVVPFQKVITCEFAVHVGYVVVSHLASTALSTVNGV